MSEKQAPGPVVDRVKFHEIAMVFPMLGKDDLAALVEDINLNGQRNPIWLFEGKILDGRNRYRACELAGIKPEFKGFYGTFDEAVAFVISENLVRRHLSVSQRAMAAARMANLVRGDNQYQKEGPPIGGPSRSISAAAKDMQVGRGTAERAKSVVGRGVPELAEAVDAGEMSVDAASTIVKLPEEKQREVLAGGKEKVKETVKELRSQPPARQEPSEDQQALRRRQKTESLFGDLVSSVLLVKKTVDQMAAVKLVMLPGDRELAEHAVVELQSVAGWLETLLKGEGVPDELPSWLDGGSK